MRAQAQSCVYRESPTAVGMSTMGAFGPPASARKRLTISGPTRPPPTITSDPLGGDTAVPAGATAATRDGDARPQADTSAAIDATAMVAQRCMREDGRKIDERATVTSGRES